MPYVSFVGDSRTPTLRIVSFQRTISTTIELKIDSLRVTKLELKIETHLKYESLLYRFRSFELISIITQLWSEMTMNHRRILGRPTITGFSPSPLVLVRRTTLRLANASELPVAARDEVRKDGDDYGSRDGAVNDQQVQLLVSRPVVAEEDEEHEERQPLNQHHGTDDQRNLLNLGLTARGNAVTCRELVHIGILFYGVNKSYLHRIAPKQIAFIQSGDSLSKYFAIAFYKASLL